MAIPFDVLPGGRIKQFRNRPPRCNCSKKTPGRPGLTRGICHGIGRRPARQDRVVAAQSLHDLRASGYDPAALDAFVIDPVVAW